MQSDRRVLRVDRLRSVRRFVFGGSSFLLSFGRRHFFAANGENDVALSDAKEKTLFFGRRES
jgi:hypothetical protein